MRRWKKNKKYFLLLLVKRGEKVFLFLFFFFFLFSFSENPANVTQNLSPRNLCFLPRGNIDTNRTLVIFPKGDARRREKWNKRCEGEKLLTSRKLKWNFIEVTKLCRWTRQPLEPHEYFIWNSFSLPFTTLSISIKDSVCQLNWRKSIFDRFKIWNSIIQFLPVHISAGFERSNVKETSRNLKSPRQSSTKWSHENELLFSF